VNPIRVPDLEVRVSLRGADCVATERIRLHWDQQPSAAAVLSTLTLLALEVEARRHELRIVHAPDELTALIALARLSAPDGPDRRRVRW
jgi:hypothetical protein